MNLKSQAFRPSAGGSGGGDVTTAQFNAHVNDPQKHSYILYVETDAEALAVVPSPTSPDEIKVIGTGRYYAKHTDNSGYTQNTIGGGGADDQTAAEVPVTAGGFTGNLSAADDDVQKALATVDALALGGGGGSSDSIVEYAGEGRVRFVNDGEWITVSNTYGKNNTDWQTACGSGATPVFPALNLGFNHVRAGSTFKNIVIEFATNSSTQIPDIEVYVAGVGTLNDDVGHDGVGDPAYALVEIMPATVVSGANNSGDVVIRQITMNDFLLTNAKRLMLGFRAANGIPLSGTRYVNLRYSIETVRALP